MINFQNYKSVLCVDGDLPQKEFFLNCKNLPIIAADGAANKLIIMGIKPDLVIGDLDGINPILIRELKTLHVPDQDSSDFQKCLKYLKENTLLPSIILGINGGFLDHILNNINIFMETENILYAPPILGQVIHGETTWSLPINTKISILGIPNANISTKGLRWEVSDYDMSFPGTTSCFNQTVKNEITITVNSGKVLVLIYSPM